MVMFSIIHLRGFQRDLPSGHIVTCGHKHIGNWKEDQVSVTYHTIVVDPITRQPGCYLPRCSWSLLNRFHTGQGPCDASLHKCMGADTVIKLLVW